MRPLLPALLLAAVATSGSAAPWDALRERTVSRSHQFIVYTADPSARAAIAMDAEDVKDKFLQLLDTQDGWKNPIVIQVNPVDAADPGHAPSQVNIVNTQDGFKVDIKVVVGSDPRQARFPQQLVRALLLEFAYRTQPAVIASGAAYPEPPSWLVEGLANLTADPDPDAGAGLFRSLIVSGKTPTLALFLSEKPDSLDGPSRTLYSACAMSLVRLLLQLPNGHALMRDFIRHWPGPNDDPEAALLTTYPALNSGSQSLEKWWTLGLASLSAGDRYEGLSLQETSNQLDGMLTFDVAIDKTGKTKSFTLDQYADFKDAPGADAALNSLSVRLLGLEAQGSPLMRDVIGAYQTQVVELAHRKDSAHLNAHLASLAAYRSRLSAHMDQIADYLNWYEATQRTQASGSFDEYIRTADLLDNDPGPPRTDPISKYMDSVQQQLSQ